jgi:hypothetical protein
LQFTDSVANNGYIGMKSGALNFGANTTTTQMTLDTSGNLGIGTSSPSTKLHVVGAITAATTGQFFASNGGTTTNQYFNIQNTGGSFFLGVESSAGGTLATGSAAYSSLLTTQGATSLHLGTNLTVRATLDTSGNLGIGTTSPTAGFRVQAVSAGGSNVIASTSSDSSGVTLYMQANGSTAGVFGTSTNHALTFVTNNTEKMRLDTSGNLGLGVTPSAWRSAFRVLSVGGAGASYAAANSFPNAIISANMYDDTTEKYVSSSNKAAKYVANGNAGQHEWYVTNTTGTAGNAITFTQAMTLDASGNLGIGTTSPTGRLEASAANCIVYSTGTGGYGSFYARGSGTNSSYIFMGNATSGEQARLTCINGGDLTFSNTAAVTESMRLATGNLLVGQTGNVGSARIAATFVGPANDGIDILDSANGSGAQFMAFRNSAGTAIGSITRVTTTNAVTYNTTSDYRLKEFVAPVTNAGERIDALNPVEFDWKETGSKARGFFAHEFQQVYASSVNGTKDAVDEDGNPVYQTMQASTAEVIADLVAEIKSLRVRLNALENK